MSRVRLHIDQVVLHGVPPDQVGAVLGGLRAEVAAGLQAGALPTEGGHLGQLRAELPRPASPGDLGTSAGRAITRAVR